MKIPFLVNNIMIMFDESEDKDEVQFAGEPGKKVFIFNFNTLNPFEVGENATGRSSEIEYPHPPTKYT